MIINTFGCSYTHGIFPPLSYQEHNTDLRENWVEKLAVRLPEHTFNNFAICNTSVAFSINQLIRVKKLLKNIPHINIFQITLPSRLTFWENSVIERFTYSPLSNLTQYSHKVFRHMQRYNASWIPSMRPYEDKDFFDKFYMWKSLDAFETEHISLIEYVKNNSDFYFFWKNDKKEYYPSILGILSEQKLKEFSSDGVYHFNEEGNNFVADWIYNSFLKFKLESRIL